MILGIGTDIIEIERVQKAVKQTQRFMEKVYTEKEQDYIKEKKGRAETIAGLFAAKEAVSKALGTGFRSFSPKDIEVVPNSLGKPEVFLLNGAQELGEALGVKNIQLSISHCQTYAVAYALVEGGK